MMSFILHSRTNVPKGESIVKPQKIKFPKMPLASLFYRGRMVISAFLYLPDVGWRISDHICDQREKIEWDSAFGKILARPERKTKFSETRQFAEIGRMVRAPWATRHLILDRKSVV